MKSWIFSKLSLIIIMGLAGLACAPEASSISKQSGLKPTLEATPPKTAWERGWEEILAAAKKEGSLLVYTSQGSDMRKEVGGAFDKSFGIKVEFVTGGTSELLNKILTERRAGLYLADIMLIGTSTLVAEFKPKELLEPIGPVLVLPEAKDPKAWKGSTPFVDKDGTTVGLLSIFTRSYLARSTELVKANEITSYRDLLEPRWKSKIVMYDPTVSGAGSSWVTSLEQVWGREQNMEFLKKLAAQDLTLTRQRRTHVEWVARGKFPLGVGVSQSDMAIMSFELKAPVAYVDVAEGGVVTAAGGGMGLLNKAAHPNAAAVFVNWIMTREGGMAMVKGHGNPSRRSDVPTTGLDPGLIPAPGVRIVNGDSEESIMAREYWQDVSREVFAQYFK